MSLAAALEKGLIEHLRKHPKSTWKDVHKQGSKLIPKDEKKVAKKNDTSKHKSD